MYMYVSIHIHPHSWLGKFYSWGWRMRGFLESFWGGWRWRMCLVLVSYLHTEVKYKTYWIMWVSLRQEVMKRLKRTVRVNDAKSCRIYFTFWAVYSSEKLFSKFYTFFLFPSILHTSPPLFPLCQCPYTHCIFLFYYPFPLDSLRSSAQCSSLLNSAHFGSSQKGPYRSNKHLKDVRTLTNFNFWSLLL